MRCVLSFRLWGEGARIPHQPGCSLSGGSRAWGWASLGLPTAASPPGLGIAVCGQWAMGALTGTRVLQAVTCGAGRLQGGQQGSTTSARRGCGISLNSRSPVLREVRPHGCEEEGRGAPAWSPPEHFKTPLSGTAAFKQAGATGRLAGNELAGARPAASARTLPVGSVERDGTSVMGAVDARWGGGHSARSLPHQAPGTNGSKARR